MKKALALTLSAALALALTACGGSASSGSSAVGSSPAASSQAVSSQAASSEAASSEGPSVSVPEISLTAVGTGAAAVTTVETGELYGQANVTMAAVLVDTDGTILQCVVDVAQNKAGVTADGKPALPALYQTKQELGDAYGMVAASTIGKEWYQQADAFAAWCVGKTPAEVADPAADAADLAAGCTIGTDDFVKAVLAACQNAAALGASAEDALHLGVVSTPAYGNTDATAEADGKLEIDTTFSAVTTSAGAVTSATVDVVPQGYTYTVDGKVSAPASLPSKKDLGDAYGMAKASSIGKEWYEQAAAFGAWCVGKTADTLGDTGDADLTAGCTISIDDLLAATAKAVAKAG